MTERKDGAEKKKVAEKAAEEKTEETQEVLKDEFDTVLRRLLKTPPEPKKKPKK